MAYDPALATRVLSAFVASVSSWIRRRARKLGLSGVLKTGGVTVIQRFSSALDLNVHFHTLMLDGIYSFAPGRAPMFHPVPAPTDEDVAAVAAAVYRKVARTLRILPPEALNESPLLALANASVQGLVATGPRRGGRLVRIQGAPASTSAFVLGRRCAQVEGFNLHANVRVHANDRAGLERICRYLARPPIGTDRLTALDDGRLLLEFKRAWRDGTTHIALSPHELIGRLIALVPRPRRHLTRHHGVLAPAFAARAAIIPGPPGSPAAVPPRPRPAPERGRPRFPARHSWAYLLWRVFLVDVLQCPRCPGRMDIVAAVTEPDAVARILNHLGIPAKAPQPHPPRPPPQGALPWGGGQPSPEVEVDFNIDPPSPPDDLG